ncbi:MAG: ynbB [Fibrobacteres bacterium]|nr:ynbB [Fibrobacterota bacterium]
MTYLSNFLSRFSPNVLWAMGGIVGILVLATIIVAILKMAKPGKDFGELSMRVRTWWVMATVFCLAVTINKRISLVFIAFLSFLALKEYLSMVPTRRAHHRVLFWAYLAIPFQFLWIGLEWYGMFIIFIPVYMFFILNIRMVAIGDTEDFLRSAGTLHWGMMITVFSLGHMAYLLVLPSAGNPAGGGPALLLYLVFLTQFNDVSQYVWGKSFGKHKITPSVSPNKTWEGFLGGFATTLALAFFLAPLLTPLTRWESILAGTIISVGGFLGDVTISAIKRDLGVKDTGASLPGHGGILDRIDSLTYAAPLFFHFIYYYHY